MAWARTVPHTLRNPLYHWTHLELKRYFGIDNASGRTHRPRYLGARKRRCLQTPELTAQGILREVQGGGALHDGRPDGRPALSPADPGKRAARRGSIPPFGPTRRWQSRTRSHSMRGSIELTEAAELQICSLADLAGGAGSETCVLPCDGLQAVRPRTEPLLRRFSNRERSAALFNKVRHNGYRPGPDEHAAVCRIPDALSSARSTRRADGPSSSTLDRCAIHEHARFQTIGPDAGFDSIGDSPQAERLARYPRSA